MFLIYVESHIKGKTGTTRLKAQDHINYQVGIIIINCFLSRFFPLLMFTEKGSHMQQIFIKGLLSVLQLMGSFVLAVGLWLRFDPETVSLLNGDKAPDTFFIGEYHTHVSCCSEMQHCIC